MISPARVKNLKPGILSLNSWLLNIIESDEITIVHNCEMKNFCDKIEIALPVSTFFEFNKITCEAWLPDENGVIAP